MDRLAIRFPEVRSVARDEHIAFQADRRCQHRLILFRQHQHVGRQATGDQGGNGDAIQKVVETAPGIGRFHEEIAPGFFDHVGVGMKSMASGREETKQFPHRTIGAGSGEQRVRVQEHAHSASRLSLARKNRRQFRFGLLELPNPLLAVDFHGKSHGWTQKDSVRCRFDDQLVVAANPEELSEFGRERHHSTAGHAHHGLHEGNLRLRLPYPSTTFTLCTFPSRLSTMRAPARSTGTSTAPIVADTTFAALPDGFTTSMS